MNHVTKLFITHQVVSLSEPGSLIADRYRVYLTLKGDCPSLDQSFSDLWPDLNNQVTCRRELSDVCVLFDLRYRPHEKILASQTKKVNPCFSTGWVKKSSKQEEADRWCDNSSEEKSNKN